MQPRIRIFFLTLVAIALLAVGYAAGRGNITFSAGKFSPAPAGKADFSEFNDVWTQLHQHYVNANLDNQKLIQGAITGLVDAVGDPYTAFFTPDQAKAFSNEISGTFEGVGMEIGSKNGKITVIAPLPNSPAEKAGIKSGDVVIAIDGVSTDGLSVEQAVTKIRGAQGTVVTVRLVTGVEKARDLKITREVITVNPIESKVITHNQKKIGYILLSNFTADSGTLFSQEARKLVGEGITGLVVDVRNDPGGYLDSAVKVASAFIPNGTVVSSVDRNGKSTPEMASGVAFLQDMPTVVLVDKGSASASEIVAGALQDTKHATIVGEQSFGKGTVQDYEKLDDGSSLKLTIAKWYTPNGRSISEHGITPDVVVTMTDADQQAGRDPQLDKAVALLAP